MRRHCEVIRERRCGSTRYRDEEERKGRNEVKEERKDRSRLSMGVHNQAGGAEETMSCKEEMAFDVRWEVYRGAREVLEQKRGAAALDWQQDSKYL